MSSYRRVLRGIMGLVIAGLVTAMVMIAAAGCKAKPADEGASGKSPDIPMKGGQPSADQKGTMMKMHSGGAKGAAGEASADQKGAMVKMHGKGGQ